MKLSSHWIRDFVDLSVDDQQLADDLTAVGLGVEGILSSGADTVFEMEIGTNRPDAMNHYGVAREAAAIYDRALKSIEPTLRESRSARVEATTDAPKRSTRKKRSSAAKAASSRGSSGAALKGRSSTRKPPASETSFATRASAVPQAASAPGSPTPPFPITVEEPDLCPRFTARIIRNTKILPSPEKLAHRLQLLDQRPISNAVDATNYVLWEIGKPTHVFDLDLLEGGQIVVRMAREGETLKTLDGVLRKLTPEDLVVCDAKKPVGLAGVMGGYDTMITEKTRNILIESAWWDPITIRKASRRHALHTDASHRFERGADFESTPLSCDRVAELILNSADGELVGGIIDVVSKPMDQAPILLHISEVKRILGAGLDSGEVFRILKKLGFQLIPEGQADAQFRVHIPSWRLDVEREIDLIEEVARLHGYNKFANTLPAYSGAVVELPNAAGSAAFRKRALALGYNEAISLTFISHADAERFSSAKVLELENPQSEEASVMRTSLVPGLLNMLARNLKRRSDNVRLFEMGPIYELSGGERVEPNRACLGATLAAVKSVLPATAALEVGRDERAAEAEAFRCFKGDVESLLDAFERETLIFDRETADYYHRGRSARAVMDGVPVAQFGQIDLEIDTEWEEKEVGVIFRCLSCGEPSYDPAVRKCPKCGADLDASPLRKQVLRKLRQDVFIAEFDLDALYHRGLRKARFSPLAKYPAAERDFSFIFDDSITFEEMRKAVTDLKLVELRDFRPAEIFRGGSIPAEKYSVLLRATFQAADRTLRDDEIAQSSAKIVTALQALGGTQRT
ncbi:MAG TPA: phenylalanine--tRNA ligase subunit beta [Candidatus Sulfotelmatobacter sp.]|nr:phenylalanine--tRNA ligase subunit beta [Candidatus Sulfotelmatobacter sp.]